MEGKFCPETVPPLPSGMMPPDSSCDTAFRETLSWERSQVTVHERARCSNTPLGFTLVTK